MKDDKDIFSSEDWQRTMEVPAVSGGKKEPPGGIFDPWNLNVGGPSESILDSIAKSLQEADKIPETLTVSDGPEEETSPEMMAEPETEKTEETIVTAEEVAEEIAPQPETKPDDTIVLPKIMEEKQEDVQATMVVPAVTAAPKKDIDDTLVVPVVESAEQEPEQEIIRQETTGGRLWPPVLMSSIFMIIACIITLTAGIMPVLLEHGFAR